MCMSEMKNHVDFAFLFVLLYALFALSRIDRWNISLLL
jgi:hypothetical protein